MDYSIFSFKAVVDFIEIEIYTVTLANAGKIEKKLRLSGVEPISPGKGNYSNVFRIKLHNLKNFAAMKAAIERIERAYRFARPPIVTMIEVALDGRLKDATNHPNGNILAMLAARMAFFASKPADPKNIRFYHGHNLGVGFDMPFSLEGWAKKMAEGWNYMSGNNYHKKSGRQQDDLTDHAYWKTTDQRQPLPNHQHSARFEPRFAGAYLPHRDIDGWEGFRFESLAGRFKWRKECEAPTATLLQQLVARRFRASHRKEIKRHARTIGGKGGGTRAYFLPADKELNDIARKRLENLSRDWKRAKKHLKF